MSNEHKRARLLHRRRERCGRSVESMVVVSARCCCCPQKQLCSWHRGLRLRLGLAVGSPTTTSVHATENTVVMHTQHCAWPDRLATPPISELQMAEDTRFADACARVAFVSLAYVQLNAQTTIHTHLSRTHQTLAPDQPVRAMPSVFRVTNCVLACMMF